MAASLTYKYCHVAPWSATSTPSAPEMSSIPIWAHLKGVPLDLRSQEGLSFAAGLVGEPKETDDYTKNLTNIEIAHVKVDADLSQKLPQLVHLKRQSGEIIPVQVEYPWVPPSCSFCHQIGHIIKDCLQTTQTWVPTSKFKQPVDEETAKKFNKDKEVAKEPSIVNEASSSCTVASHGDYTDPACATTHDDPPTATTNAERTEDAAVLIPAITPPVFQFSVLNSSTPPPVPDHQNTLALSTPQTTRETLYPSKHRPSLKRSYISTTHSNLLELNPFAILLTSPKKSLYPLLKPHLLNHHLKLLVQVCSFFKEFRLTLPYEYKVIFLERSWFE